MGVDPGVDPARAEAAVRGLAEALPFFRSVEAGGWRAPSGAVAAAWTPAAGPYVTGSGDGLTAWAGRPVSWGPGGRADGRGPLEPAYYADPAGGWPSGLDGRYTAVRWDESARRLTAVADALGAYPLYRADADGVTWLSNRVEPLRALIGARAVDLDALASLLGGGWPLGGRPVWADVRRVAPGVLTLEDSGEAHTPLLEAAEVAAMCGAGWDAQAAAKALVEGVRALADWPGRPSVVPVTAGRDSRLVFAAALRAGLSFDAVTGGAPGSPDVVGGQALCAAAGVSHSLLPADPHGDPWSTPEEAARVLGLTASGTASLGDAAGFPLGPRPGPPGLWHSGQGGEIARRYYRAAAGRDRDAAVDGLERVFCGRRTGRAEPLSDTGRAAVRAGLERWVDGRLESGARVEDLPDLFYLDERMGSWAGPTHGAVEWVRDTTSPLWSVRLLGHLLGGTVEERSAETFHSAVLRELSPELVGVPYEGGAASKRGMGHKVRRGIQEVRRRVAPGRAGGPEAAVDPFDNVLSAVRRAAASHPDHVAWRVLDRARVDALLSRPAAGLDDMNRHYVWRIATVLLDPAMAEGEA